MINDLQEYVEGNPDLVTVITNMKFDFFVFIKLDPILSDVGRRLIYIEVECWRDDHSFIKKACIHRYQFDVWLRDKKISNILYGME